jgi:hypothetical protein
MTQMPKFMTRKDFRPMTAAERQRRCRANGKGRHRGGGPTPTKADRERWRQEFAAMVAAAQEAEDAAEAAAAAGAKSFTLPQASPSIAVPVLTTPAAVPIVDWNLSAMAA